VTPDAELADVEWRGTICLSLAIGFEEDRVRRGLRAAVERLRDALAFNGLSMDGDATLLAGVLAGGVSAVQLAESICSRTRIGLPVALVVH